MWHFDYLCGLLLPTYYLAVPTSEFDLCLLDTWLSSIILETTTVKVRGS